jgi:group I intron endonuclease
MKKYNGIIYCATSPSQKKYYGFSFNFEKRKKEHLRASKKSKNSIFYKAINKYGFENFYWEIKESFENKNKEILKELLRKKESYWIRKDKTFMPNGYNMTLGGDGGDTLSNHPNIKLIGRKISKKNTGKRRSKETKKKISDAKKGVIFSEETKKKMSIQAKRRMNKPEEKKRLSELAKQRTGNKNPFYGRTHTEETKNILREKCPKFGKENGMYGRTHTNITKEIIGEKNKIKPKKICPYCKKEIDIRNYARWHGKKCKYKTSPSFCI